jgi:cold shock CspA family protein
MKKERFKGQISKVNPEKTFGYIEAPVPDKKDVFFHVNNFITFSSDNSVEVGAMLSYEMGYNQNGPCATRLQLLDVAKPTKPRLSPFDGLSLGVINEDKPSPLQSQRTEEEGSRSEPQPAPEKVDAELDSIILDELKPISEPSEAQTEDWQATDYFPSEEETVESGDDMPMDAPPPSYEDLVGLFRGGEIFEHRIHSLINSRFPNSTLRNIPVYDVTKARFLKDKDAPRLEVGVEVDLLMHIKNVNEEKLILIECKNIDIEVVDKKWLCRYHDKIEGKDVKNQILQQASALLHHLQPISTNKALAMECWVVCGKEIKEEEIDYDRDSLIRLMDQKELTQKVDGLYGVLRVAQSEYLSILRRGIPVPELGHPEISNAIRYVNRCRETIDMELFRSFQPKAERWAINGSAGMGKSVLLAYALFSMATGMEIFRAKDGLEPKVNDLASKKLGIPALKHRKILVLTLKENQRIVIHDLLEKFLDDYSPLLGEGMQLVLRPRIEVWTPKTNLMDGPNILMIDEAHDLTQEQQLAVAKFSETDGHYLVVACDRHQKLRLIDPKAPIIQGLSFSLKTTKLYNNYRSPFPIYMASLSLLFRWFAPLGPMVIPKEDDLTNGFGFQVHHYNPEKHIDLGLKNDSHPANGWSYSVSSFSNGRTLFEILSRENLKPKNVLWARFGKEDPDFDYELLGRVTYHDLTGSESSELINKYIKGRDFEIVVLEGLSEVLNYELDDINTETMWRKRREIFLCASRATTFLYFVKSGAGGALPKEIQNIQTACSSPTDSNLGLSWKMRIHPSEVRLPFDVYKE